MHLTYAHTCITCMQTNVQTLHTHVYIYILIYINREREIYIYMYIYLCIYTCITFMHSYVQILHKRIFIFLYINRERDIYVYMYMYPYIYTCITFMHSNMQTSRTHTHLQPIPTCGQTVSVAATLATVAVWTMATGRESSGV